MADFQPKPRTKTALDDIKWRLRGDKVLEGGKYPPTLSFVQQTNGNPMLEIYLNNGEKDINKLRIQVKMDQWMADIIFETIEEAVKTKEENFKRVLEVKAQYLYGKRLDQPKVVAKVIVGKNEQGRVYLGVAADGKPAVRFTFEANTDWFNFCDGNGNPLPTEAVDRIFCLSWVKGVRATWQQLFTQNWKAPAPKDNNGKGGNYNNRNKDNGNYGSGSGASSSDSFDDDFDW